MEKGTLPILLRALEVELHLPNGHVDTPVPGPQDGALYETKPLEK